MFLSYARELKFEEHPDYDYLRNLFDKGMFYSNSVLRQLGEQDDGVFDWMILLDQQRVDREERGIGFEKGKYSVQVIPALAPPKQDDPTRSPLSSQVDNSKSISKANGIQSSTRAIIVQRADNSHIRRELSVNPKSSESAVLNTLAPLVNNEIRTSPVNASVAIRQKKKGWFSFCFCGGGAQD
jgi:hypothetical protein